MTDDRLLFEAPPPPRVFGAWRGEGASHNNLSSVISVTGMRGGVRYYYDIIDILINALLYSKPLIQFTRK